MTSFTIGGLLYKYPELQSVENCRQIVTPITWIPTYDTRGDETVLSDYGEVLYGSEKAAYLLGLRTGYGLSQRHDRPLLCLAVQDDLRLQEAALIKLLALAYEYAHALRIRFLKGTMMLPVCVCISNYSITVLGDARVTRPETIPNHTY